MFYDLDPLARAAIFGTLFLGSLGFVLWVWWDSTTSVDPSRWIWRIVGSLFVAATVPAVVLGAANLDTSKENLLNIFAWASIASAVGALLTVVLYGTLGRAPAVVEPAYTPLPPLPDPTPLPPPAPPRPRRPAIAHLVVKSGPDQGQQFDVYEVTTIGRGRNSTITLDDGRVSENHAQLKLAGRDFVFTDLESTNGSFLRVAGQERPIHRPQPLVDGDELRLGRTVLQFLDSRNGRAP